MGDPGMDDLEQIALERTRAGQRCVAVKFRNANRGQIVDLDGDGDVIDGYSVPLDGLEDTEPDTAA